MSKFLGMGLKGRMSLSSIVTNSICHSLFLIHLIQTVSVAASGNGEAVADDTRAAKRSARNRDRADGSAVQQQRARADGRCAGVGVRPGQRPLAGAFLDNRDCGAAAILNRTRDRTRAVS